MTDDARAEAESDQSNFTWMRVIRLFAGHRGAVVIVVGVVVVTAVLGIVNPLLIQVVFDQALFPEGADGANLTLLWQLCGLMLAVTVATGALGVLQTVVTNRLGQTVLADLRAKLFRHLQGLSLNFYSDARTGELQSRITNDVGGIQTAVTSTVSSLLSNAVTFASAVVAMTLLSWQLTIVALITVPLFFIATRWVGERRRVLTRETQQAQSAISTVTQETLSVSGIVLAKLYGQQEREISRFEQENQTLAAVATRQQVIGQSFFTVIQTFLGATPIVAYLVAGYLTGNDSGLSAGTIVAFTTLQGRVFFPVARSLETLVELSSSRALFERIFAYLDTAPDVVEPEAPVEVDPEKIDGRVEFARTELRFPGTERNTIDGVSFTVEPGQLIALVGPSGSGKSTLLNLATRLYDPTGGSVSIDGHDLRDLSTQSLASIVGLVTQESYLFAGTIADNIAYGKPGATEDEVRDAAQSAAILDRIEQFDDGFATTVGERGFRLSGGERQRVSIARVLLSDPRVLILDEATSALDTASERRIQEALSEVMVGRSTIAVAHRLSTILSADTIHVIDEGQIVESGTHAELLANGGIYEGLYNEQFEGGAVEARCADGTVYSDGSHRYHSHAHDHAVDDRIADHQRRRRHHHRPSKS